MDSVLFQAHPTSTHTDTHRHTDTDTDPQTHTDTQTQTQTQTHTDTQTHTHTHTHTKTCTLMVLLVHGNIKRGAGSRWARKKKWKRKATNQNKTKQASDSFEHNLGVVVVDVVAVVVDGRGQADIYLRYHIWRDLSRLIFFWSCSSP